MLLKSSIYNLRQRLCRFYTASYNENWTRSVECKSAVGYIATLRSFGVVPVDFTCTARAEPDGTRAETSFRLSPKRTSPFKSAGESVQPTAGSRGVRISVSNAGYTTFRGRVRVLATHSIRQFPLHFPSRVPPHSERSILNYMFEGRYSDSLRAGRLGDRIPVGARFSAPIQTGPGTYPTSYTRGTGYFPEVKRLGRGVDFPPPSSTEVKERVELYL